MGRFVEGADRSQLTLLPDCTVISIGCNPVAAWNVRRAAISR